jgi:cell division protein FtsB
VRRVHLLLRLLLCTSVVTTVGFLAFQCLSPLRQRSLVRDSYQETVDHLEDSTAQMESAERRLRLLTSSPEAVEREVRSQYQMLRPGETLYLLEEEDPLMVQPINSTTDRNLIAASH